MSPSKMTFDFLDLLQESDQYKDDRLDEVRAISAILFVVAGFFGATLWIWDYVTDPVGSKNTFEFRLLFLFLTTPLYFAFKHLSRRYLSMMALAVILLGEILFVYILNYLASGMIYGIGGFVIFLFMPLLMLQGFSLRLNLICTLLTATIPHLLGLANFAHDFEHAHYAVLIWPTSILVMLIQISFAHNYRRRHVSEAALKVASNTDPMTGASNRRHFMPQLKKELARGRRLKRVMSLLILDIDHFKKVNDTYGHPTGDLVICTLADICRDTIREIDLLARLGGEEFAIMFPETDLRAASLVAERIRLAVEKRTVKSMDDIEFNFTVSIGITEQKVDDDSEDALINRADAALYQAKTKNRNRVEVA